MFIFPNLVFFQLVAVSMMLTEFLSTSFGLGILFAIMGLCVWTYAVPKYNTVYAVGFTVFSGLPEWSTDIAYVLDSHRKHLKPEDVDFLGLFLFFLFVLLFSFETTHCCSQNSENKRSWKRYTITRQPQET